MRVSMESVGTQPLFRATGEKSGYTMMVEVRGGEGVAPEGPYPMELIAMGLGGCLADNIVVILNKKRVTFTGVRMDIEADRAPESPKRFTAVRIRCTVQGSDLPQADLDKIIELAAKYCSAHATLSEGTPISTLGVVEKAPAVRGR